MNQMKDILPLNPLSPETCSIPPKTSPVLDAVNQNKESPLLSFSSFNFQNPMHIKISFHNYPLPISSHKHDYYEGFFVYSGTFVHASNHHNFPLETGDFLLIPPNMVHSIDQCSKDGVGINLLLEKNYFQATILPLLNTSMSSCLHQITFYACHNHPQLQTLIENLTEEAFLPNHQNEGILTSYTVLLLNQCERISSEQALNKEILKKQQRRDLIYKILETIQLRYKDISLTKLSTQYGYSHDHISRLIKEETGLSFHQYRLDIQLQQAAQLLEQSEISVSSIAELTGFSNNSFFYRKFKEKYNVTPTQYRKKQFAS